MSASAAVWPLAARLAVTAAAMLAYFSAFRLRRYLGGIWLASSLAAAVSLGLAVVVQGPALWALVRPAPLPAGVGLALGGAMVAATQVGWAVARPLIPALDREIRQLYRILDDPPGPRASSPVLLLLVAAEEAVWRGVLLSALAPFLPPVWAGSVSVVAYALPQAGSGSWALVAVGLGAGAVWTAERYWTASLLAPALTHVIWDAAVFVLLPLRAG